MESFYQLSASCELVNTRGIIPNDMTTKQVYKFFKDKSYRMTEDCIIQALFFHHFLTKKNIGRFVDAKLKEKKKDDYSNTLKRMWKDGTIERYQYGTVMLYTLPDATYEYALEKYKNLSKREFVRPDIKNTAKVLECASLAQLHISIFCGEKTKRSFFYERAKIGEKKFLLPSYMEFKKEDYVFHTYSTILPKEVAALETFIKEIHTLSALLRGKIHFKRNDIFLHIIAVPDLTILKKVAKTLMHMPETKDMAFYFVLEEQTIHTKGLSVLYTYKENGNDIDIDTITFTSPEEYDYADD